MEAKFGRAAKEELTNNGIDWSSIKDTEHFNHATCPAGADLRRRLYVSKKDYGYVYFCHNCQGKGYFSDDHIARIVTEETAENKTTKYGFKWSSFRDSNPEEAVILFLGQYEMDLDEYKGYIKAGNDCAVRFAICHEDDVVGYQRRALDGDFLKWTTFIDSSTEKIHYLRGDTYPTTVVVVEDLISSYKVWSLGYSVVALMGTSLKSFWPFKDTEKVVIWLDNDVAGHKGALELNLRLSSMFQDVRVVVDTQPKEVPYTRLKEVLEV